MTFISPERQTFGMKIIPILAALLVPATSMAQAPPSWAEFTRTFQAYADSDQVVGASVVLMKNGRVIGRYDSGHADRAKRIAVDSQTIFHWGSITKSLTAISIMQLRDRGKLSLDDRIVRWVPELRTMHDPFGMMDSITIRMLLNHTAGFQGGTWPYGDGQPWEPFEPTTWNQLVAMMPYQRLLFRPGSRYSYSNPAFIYLARVIEQLTGDPWDAYVQKNIFAPLELTRSYFRGTPYYLAAHRSHNYNVRKDSAGRPGIIDNGADFDPGITSPNGAWNAPLGDLVKYTAFLTNAVLPGMSRERYDVVLSRQEPRRDVAAGEADVAELRVQSTTMDGTFLLRPRPQRPAHPRPHGKPGGIPVVLLLRSRRTAWR